ncbi:MAG: VCBS repeat-containing protein [Bacteroidales bacterium]|nr:VCBS repeat-containing protein [Bacteroidales bacterium]
MKKMIFCTMLAGALALSLSLPAQYPFGNCIHLDGDNDYIILADESAFDFPVNMTVECWLKVDEWDRPWQAVITKGDNAWRLQRDNETNKIVFVAGDEHVITSTSFTDNLWHHLAGVKSGSTLRLYVDGVQESTTGGAGNNTNNGYSVRMGENGQVTGRYFDGVIEEVRFWNYARTLGDINENMYKTLAGNETGLVAYYKLDETSGLTAFDATAAGHHGTLMNMTGNEWESTTIPMVFSEPGYAIDFNGSDEYVSCGYFPEIGQNNPKTIEAWAYTRSFNNGGIFQGGTLSSNSDFSLRTLTEPGKWRMDFNGDYKDILLPFSQNSWHHFCLSFDGTTHIISLYYDGALVASYYKNLQTGCLDFLIGRWSSYFFDGCVDEVRVWNVCRTQDEILNSMNSALAGNETGLVSYWQCSYGSGSTLYDYTGGRHGTMHNMATQNWVASGIFQFSIHTHTIPDGFTGVMDFSNAGLSMFVNQKTGTEIYTVLRYPCSPNVFPQFPDEIFDSQHWLFYRQGNGTMNATLTFSVIEDILPGDSLCPQRVKLLKSTVNSSSWSLATTAISVDYTNNTMTFNNLSAFGMFITGRQETVSYTALSPPNGFPGTGVNQDLELTFERPMQAGAGNLHIIHAADSTLFETIPASGAVIDSNTVTFDPAGTFEHIASYFVLVDSTALYDFAGTAFRGISDSSEWSFSTPRFSPTITLIPGVASGSGCRWGDYDNDGDPDIALMGQTQSSEKITKVFSNDGNNIFTDLNAGLIGNRLGVVPWEDTDGDDDLDLLSSGSENNRLYQNMGDHTFASLSPWSCSAYYGHADWGDFDNDGDPDMLLCGLNCSDTKIYRNDGNNSFTDINAAFPLAYGKWSYGAQGLSGWGHGRSLWIDYDLDGDLDVYLAGNTGGYNCIARIYRNDGPGTTSYWSFTQINTGFYTLTSLGADWGDYDNDGDPDLLVTGAKDDNLNFRTIIYKNNGNGTFSEINLSISGMVLSSVEWGDYDNDGDLDILISGSRYENNSLVPTAAIYRNDGENVFYPLDELEALTNGQVSWGDHDLDGDLDIMMCGNNPANQAVFLLYTNQGMVSNTPPSSPPNLSCTHQYSNDLKLVFGWDAASDNETPSAGLSYNVYFTLLRNGQEVKLKRPMADTVTGYRRLPKTGNAGQMLSHYLRYPELPMLTQKYRHYGVDWGVQAIDHSFAGSPFNNASHFFMREITYLATSNHTEMKPADWLTWEVQHLASLAGYSIQVDEQAGFINPLEDYIDINSKKGKMIQHDKGLTYSIALNELGFYPFLTDNTVYHWRMRPVYLDGDSTCFTHPAPWFFFNKENTAPFPPMEGFNPAGDVAIGTLTPLISWNAAFDPDSISDHPGTLRYTVEVDTNNTFSSMIYTQTTAMGITYVQVNPALMEGYRYYYRIKTMDDEGLESAWSATQSFRVFDITLYLTVNLEGPFDGTGMNTSLNPEYIPLAQPYNTSPWYYSGTEAVSAIPGPGVVEWILVELRDAADAASAGASTVIAYQAAFLLNDGTVAGLDGSAPIHFYIEIQHNLFVVIHHRNHLSIMTPVPIPENSGIYTWDFTSGPGQVHGGMLGHKELAPGIWGMSGGDGFPDNQINNGDKNDVWVLQAGTGGYLAGDFNMDGQVNNADKNDVWAPNTGLGGQVPE